MNKKKKIRMLIIQLIVLFLAVGATFLWIQSEKKEITIYDYTRTIKYNEKSNYQITEVDITPIQLMVADYKKEYVSNKDEIVGKYLTGDAFKDSHVLNKQLSTDPPHINKSSLSSEKELRKYYLPVNYGSAFAGDIKAGDIVDLMFLDKNAGIPTEDTSKVASAENIGIQYSASGIFAQGLSVYQVYTIDGNVYEKRDTDPMSLGNYHGELSGGGSVGGNHSVTETGETTEVATEEEEAYAAPAFVALAVTAQQYEEISARVKMGEVTMVGRFGGSQDTKTNGYLVAKGDTADIYVGQGNLEKDVQLFDASQPVTPTINELPKLYTFIRDLPKVQTTDDQKQRYTSIYTRYAIYMEMLNGPDWEKNSPDEVTMDRLAAIASTDENAIAIFMTFKNDLEVLSKELRGNQVVLPW